MNRRTSFNTVKKAAARRRGLLTGGACILICLCSALVIWYNIRAVNKNMNERLDKSLQLARQTLPPAIWQFNYDYLRNFSRALFLDEKVVWTRILTDQEVLATKFRPEFENKPFSYFQNSDDFMTGRVNIEYDNKTIGSVQIALSRKGVFLGLILNTILAVFIITAVVITMAAYYARLQASEKRFRRLYNNAIEGIFQSTADGRFLNVNPAMARTLGYESPEDLLAKVVDIGRQVYSNPEDRRQVVNTLSTRGYLVGFETQFKKKNRELIWVSISAQARRDSTGEPLRFDGLIIEISERKQREKAEREKEAAEMSARARSEFLANMSHEVRTPMNAVIGLINLVMKTSLNERQKEYMEKVKYSALALLRIINDILDFSKIEAGKLDFEYVGFTLQDIFEDLTIMFADLAAEKGISFLISVDDKIPPTIIGDPVRLRQILINLVANAVKFTEFGEVVVGVEPVPWLPSDIRMQNRVKLKFFVKDTGIGIEEQKIHRLFKAFTQADSSTTRKYGGTGLGLTISKHLVEMMGGALDVSSVPGKGSVFSFTVMLSISEDQPEKLMLPPELKISKIPAADSSLSSQPETSREPIRILLVEDNKINQVVASEILRYAGITVDIACNGHEAVLAVQESEHHLILMDIQMPVMDGYEATRRIRKLHESMRTGKSDAGTGRPPIIAMTAHAMSGDRQKCIDAGMDDYLPKPIETDKLFKMIEKWVPNGFDRAAALNSAEKSPENGSESGFDTLENEVKAFTDVHPLYIDINNALKRINWNRSLLITILKEFRERYQHAVATIEDFMNRGDLESAAKYVHEIKGVSANISAKSLHYALEHFESMIKSRAPEACLQAFEESSALMEKTLAEIPETISMLESLEVEDKNKNDRSEKESIEEIIIKLNELAGLIQKNSIKAETFFNAFKQSLFDSGFQTDGKELEKLIQSYNFKDAARRLEGLLKKVHSTVESPRL